MGADHIVDTDAMESDLYRRYFRPARLFGLRYVRDAQAAEDLAQQAMLITIEKLRAGEIADRDRIGSFILGTCRMLAQNLMRTERRRRDILDRVVDGPALDPEETGLSEPKLIHRLAECLGGLAERSRTVILLTFYAERSAEDIARELGLKPGNVRVIRHRALTDLQHCMRGSS